MQVRATVTCLTPLPRRCHGHGARRRRGSCAPAPRRHHPGRDHPHGHRRQCQQEDKDKITAACHTLNKALIAAGLRVTVDERDNYTTGWKFNHWELKGS